MKKTSLILFAGDMVLALLVAIGVSLVDSVAPAEKMPWEEIVRIAVFTVGVMAASYLAELFAPGKYQRKRHLFLQVTIASTMAYAGLWLVRYWSPEMVSPADRTLSNLALFGMLQFTFHSGFHLLFRIPGMTEKILIYGGGPIAEQIAGLLAVGPYDYVAAGMIPAVSEPAGKGGMPPKRPESLSVLALREKIDKIVISLSERRGVLPVGDILGCKLSGIEVVDAVSFYEEMTGKVMVENINPSWFIFSGTSRMTAFRRFYKRTFDLCLSAIGILLCLPLLPLLALLIKIDSPGPIFFRQTRVGKDEKNFTLFKLRTMRLDAEKGTGAVWATENDPRITRVGRWLRKSRLDEIPQLFNVIQGDMSLVGPRPERPEFVAQLGREIPFYPHRHRVKPGATGWAQVKYAYGASVEDAMEKLRYDLYYIKNYSFTLDLIILVETVKVVLFGRGAR